MGATPALAARPFAVAAPHQRWAADITALPTRAGWCDLAVVLDLGSRRVVGWAMRASLEVELVLAALHVALACRPSPPLHHSDRGSQYASDAYREVLAQRGIAVSMSRVGNGWDNAPVESFFSSLKALSNFTINRPCNTKPHSRPLYDFSNLSTKSGQAHSDLLIS